MLPFALAGASVIGAEHRERGLPNQDAWSHLQNDQMIVAAVADGCGSTPRSQFGAEFGCRRLVDNIVSRLVASTSSHIKWDEVEEDMTERMVFMARMLGGNFLATVRDYLLFSLVGVVMTEDRTQIVACGDPFIFVNGVEYTVGPFPNNTPPYLGYKLLSADELNEGMRQTLSVSPNLLTVVHELPTSELNSLVIGSDGVTHLKAAAIRNYPGQNRVVGPIDQLWQNPWFTRNPDALRRTLALANREVVRADWGEQTLNRELGLLPDDTTLVVIRRKEDSDGATVPRDS